MQPNLQQLREAVRKLRFPTLQLNDELPRWRRMLVIRRKMSAAHYLARRARLHRYANRVLGKGYTGLSPIEGDHHGNVI